MLHHISSISCPAVYYCWLPWSREAWRWASCVSLLLLRTDKQQCEGILEKHLNASHWDRHRHFPMLMKMNKEIFKCQTPHLKKVSLISQWNQKVLSQSYWMDSIRLRKWMRRQRMPFYHINPIFTVQSWGSAASFLRWYFCAELRSLCDSFGVTYSVWTIVTAALMLFNNIFKDFRGWIAW